MTTVIPADLIGPMVKTSGAVWLYGLMPDLHSASPFLVWSVPVSAEEQEEFISGLLTDISDSQVLDSEEKSALLLLMIAIEDKTRVIRAAIDKRLRRIGRQNPELFKKLLPPLKDGFRRKARKRV